MKKLFLSALIATTVATAAFATDANKISYRVMNSFKSQFNQADNVTWTLRENFAKATFKQEGKTIEAFYNLNGESIGTSKHISVDELPTNAKRVLAKRYNGYNVTEAIQFDGIDENAYYVSVENDSEKVVLKVDSFDSVSLYKKDRKN